MDRRVTDRTGRLGLGQQRGRHDLQLGPGDTACGRHGDSHRLPEWRRGTTALRVTLTSLPRAKRAVPRDFRPSRVERVGTSRREAPPEECQGPRRRVQWPTFRDGGPGPRRLRGVLGRITPGDRGVHGSSSQARGCLRLGHTTTARETGCSSSLLPRRSATLPRIERLHVDVLLLTDLAGPVDQQRPELRGRGHLAGLALPVVEPAGFSRAAAVDAYFRQRLDGPPGSPRPGGPPTAPSAPSPRRIASRGWLSADGAASSARASRSRVRCAPSPRADASGQPGRVVGEQREQDGGGWVGGRAGGGEGQLGPGKDGVRLAGSTRPLDLAARAPARSSGAALSRSSSSRRLIAAGLGELPIPPREHHREQRPAWVSLAPAGGNQLGEAVAERLQGEQRRRTRAAGRGPSGWASSNASTAGSSRPSLR